MSVKVELQSNNSLFSSGTNNSNFHIYGVLLNLIWIFNIGRDLEKNL